MKAILILSLIAVSLSAYTLTVNKQISKDGYVEINYSEFGIPSGQTITNIKFVFSAGSGTLVSEMGSTTTVSGSWWTQCGSKTVTLNNGGSVDWSFSSSDNLKYADDGHLKWTNYYSGSAVTLQSIVVTAGSGSGSSTSSSSGSSSSSSSSSSGSSSTATKVDLGGKCPTLTTVSGGVSGSGYATRYWDCCKPSCSWTSNAGSGNEARQCTTSGALISDTNAKSICEGGPSMTCTSQIPFTIDGCSNLGFAFAAVPGYSPMCGRCFLLTFTGTGKYETKANHEALKGKKLLVMATNIGYDVAGGQFDVMIPGGGVGIYNGCANVWSTAGQQYGGLLSDCESSVGYSGDLLTKRKNCLIEKCNDEFEDHADGLAGCLFLANYMEAAGNPNHNYVEVECPDFMKQKY